MKTPVELGQRIKEIRLEYGLTQDQVAKALDATPGYVSNVENGRTAMSLRMLTYFSKLTDTTIDSLVGSMDTEYKGTALDNEIQRLTNRLSDEDKQKLIKTLKIWKA